MVRPEMRQRVSRAGWTIVAAGAIAAVAGCALGSGSASGTGPGAASSLDGGAVPAATATYPADAFTLRENSPLQRRGESLVASGISATGAIVTAFGGARPAHSFEVHSGTVFTTAAGVTYRVVALAASTAQSPAPGARNGSVVVVPG